MYALLQIICRFLLSFFLFFTTTRYDSPIIRQTLNGAVEGITEISVFGQKYYAFLGIPFAEPPITGRDPYTGEQIDRRFKVLYLIDSNEIAEKNLNLFSGTGTIEATLDENVKSTKFLKFMHAIGTFSRAIIYTFI